MQQSQGLEPAYFLQTSRRQIGSASSELAMDAVILDYNRPESLRAAFQGCDQLFLLGPNAPNQSELERNAVVAAKAAGVRHIVKQSVMGADGEDYSLAKVHRPVEKTVESSGLTWTFLRPSSFMQNVVTYMGKTIKAEGAFYSASGEARISHVDVRDIAAVAVKALTEPNHDGKAYTLTGPEALTYDELASELSKALGRSISHVNLSPSDLRDGMLAEGMPDEIADRMLDLERYYREDRASRITNDIKQIAGRDPRRFAQYAPVTVHRCCSLDSEKVVVGFGTAPLTARCLTIYTGSPSDRLKGKCRGRGSNPHEACASKNFKFSPSVIRIDDFPFSSSLSEIWPVLENYEECAEIRGVRS